MAFLDQQRRLLLAKETARAKAQLKKFQAHNRGQEGFYLAAAALYCHEGLFRDGSQILANGLKYFPRSLELHYQSARIWLKVDEYDMAEPELRICLTLAPDSSKVHGALADLYNQRDDYKSALKETDKALSSSPGDADIWMTRGCVLRNLGRFQEAVTALDTSVKLSGHVDYNARKMRAPILERLGRYDDAISDYRYILDVDPKHDYQVQVNIGNCYMAKKQPAEALKYFDLSLKSKEDYIPGHRARLAALDAIKDTTRAEKERKYIKQMEADYSPNK